MRNHSKNAAYERFVKEFLGMGILKTVQLIGEMAPST